VWVSEEAFVDATLSPVGFVGEGFEGFNGTLREWMCGVFEFGFALALVLGDDEERGIADIRVSKVVRVVRRRVWCILVVLVSGGFVCSNECITSFV
jgi:hypothetical protein